MKTPKTEWNTVYISERIRESLREISKYALTVVVAPMGYGKTTSVGCFLSARIRSQHATVIRINIYSDNISLFWTSVQNAFADAGFESLKEFSLPTDAVGAGLLKEELCRAFSDEKPYYIFLDDYHLLKNERVTVFLCDLARIVPENVHFILATRNTVLKNEDVIRLGSALYTIDKETLSLNHTEISVYAERCGLELKDMQIDELLELCEGWFSAVYFALRSYAEYGHLPEGKRSIYEMFTSTLIDPLPAEEKEFLTVMGLADEFTLKMAENIAECGADTAKTLNGLIEQNSFITRLSDGETYRFHHIMKECAGRAFETFETQKQKTYLDRYGKWFEGQGQYIHALRFYEMNKDYDAVLNVIEKDAGILLASIGAERVIEDMKECSDEILKKHPNALLVLMRRMFTWRQIPVMMRCKALLEAAIEEQSDLTEEEKGNLLGERDLVMSFLQYNDIKAMSALHRSAAAQMTRPAVSMHNEGSWTFGSPSVLQMYHREAGALEEEQAAMNECMPYYYKLMNGHGQGAELIMEAEAAFLQCCFEDAEISLEKARTRASEHHQVNMELCCDFLESRLSLCRMSRDHRPEEKRAKLIRLHYPMWLNINDCICAYYYALRLECDRIPALFKEHRLSEVSFLMPGKPMMELVENQVYLAQGEYVKVIGRSEGLLGLCEAMHYALVKLHILIQTAAAYEKLGKRNTALDLIKKAVELAHPDGFIMPFAENDLYISSLLQEYPAGERDEFIEKIISEGKAYRKKLQGGVSPALLSLSEKELEIVKRIVERRSNKEIAEELFLSEGTVKQYANRIYAKLSIEGDHHNKRRLLAELLYSQSD